MAFYMEDVGGDGEGCNGGANRLDNVVVRAEEMKGRGLVVNGLEEVFDNCIIVHWDGEGWVGVSVRIHVGVFLKKCLYP
jgi:hypothetical protein